MSKLLQGFYVHQLAKFIHTSSITSAANKTQLSKLRKKTGFTFVNCKKALEKFDNDLKKAEDWLRSEAQKEGWAKATKLQGRAIAQGLIGLSQDGNSAAIVEVKCETDFVAKNSKFVDLVKIATGACLQHGKNSTTKKLFYNEDDLGNLELANHQKLSDFVALQIGSLGENMAVQRGVFIMSSDNNKIGSYVHAAGPQMHKFDKHCQFGKYGAVITYIHNQSETLSTEKIPEKDIGRQLAQHIVGMNPKTIGSMEDFKRKQDERIKDINELNESSARDGEINAHDGQIDDNVERSYDEEPTGNISDDDDEDRMIFQDFLVQPDIKVGEFLIEHDIEILDYIRFECGEKLTED